MGFYRKITSPKHGKDLNKEKSERIKYQGKERMEENKILIFENKLR